MELTAYAAHDAFVSRLAEADMEGAVLRLRQAVEARTGAVDSEDDGFESRMLTFWDRAVTDPALLGEIRPNMDADLALWSHAFERAHRGLFRVARVDVSGGAVLTLEDVWGGAAFLLSPPPPRELALALESTESLFDGRLVGACDSGAGEGASITLLPGAFFHPPDATGAIEGVVAAAQASGLSRDDALDALLRMEARLSAHSRVKPGYAYRPESLRRS